MGQQNKTGILHLEEDKEVVQIFFDKGMIVGTALPAVTGEETALGKKLILGRLITAENWKKAYQQHKEKLLGIEKVLVNSGMVTREDLCAALRLLTFDTIYSLFKWKGGSFRFETKPVSYDPEFVEPLNAEYLLLDILRMVDEWPLIAERIPGFDIVLQKTNPLATLEVLQGTAWEKNRTFQMEVIYDLIDGQRSVKEIIDLSFMEEFETCKNLIVLMDAGLVETTSLRRKKEKEKREGVPLSRYLAQWGTYFLVGLLVLFFSIQLMMTRVADFPFSSEERKGWYIIQEAVKKIREAKMENAREVFFLEENRNPAGPAEMVQRGLLSP